MNFARQLELLALFKSKFEREYALFPSSKTTVSYEYYLDNGKFGRVDGELLYCFVRFLKPSRIIEIGSGNSTYLSAKAILANRLEDHNYTCELIAIDPQPNKTLIGGFPGLSEVIPRAVQEVPLAEFESLRKNDILFIDSTHSLKIGSDVHYEYLEIIPRLQAGVVIHVHDIFLPNEYPREWITKYFLFPNEQYVLQALLSFSDRFEVLMSASYLQTYQPESLGTAFNSYRPGETIPGSFWFRKIK